MWSTALPRASNTEEDEITVDLPEYRDGQRGLVWHELRRMGEQVREAECLPQARAVCDEMARRARHNVETLVERLTNQGFVFHDNNDDQTPRPAFIPPTSKAADLVDWLDDQPYGPVPLTVASWIRLVGDVWFVGTHPQWPQSTEADPLVLEAEQSFYSSLLEEPSTVRDYYADEYESWQDWSDDDPQADGFVLTVAPDRLHKANTSGGSPYGFALPDRGADGLFAAETTMPFVDYLNHVFANGGFFDPVPEPLRAELTTGLLEL